MVACNLTNCISLDPSSVISHRPVQSLKKRVYAWKAWIRNRFHRIGPAKCMSITIVSFYLLISSSYCWASDKFKHGYKSEKSEEGAGCACLWMKKNHFMHRCTLNGKQKRKSTNKQTNKRMYGRAIMEKIENAWNGEWQMFSLWCFILGIIFVG